MVDKANGEPSPVRLMIYLELHSGRYRSFQVAGKINPQNTRNRPNGIKIREQCPKKSRIKMQEVGEGKLKTGKSPKKSIANKPAGKQ